MDKNEIRQNILDLSTEGVEILLAGTMEYDKNIYKNASEKQKESYRRASEKIDYPKTHYHSWYAKAYKVVRIFAPERLEEFERFYTGDKTIKKIEDLNAITAGITHYLQGWIVIKDDDAVNFNNTFESGLREQFNIINAILKNLDNDLFNLESGIHYEIYQSEMDIARNLYKKKYFRAAGSIAGVVVEVHLKKVVDNRDVPLADKADPGMSAYNDALKKHDIYKTPTFSLIQMCGHIRNKCVHPKQEDPTDGEISSIISAAERILVEVH